MNKSAGIGLPGVLLVVFIVLKLTGNIDWSWWWVLSPAWICLLIWAVFGIFLLVILFAAYASSDEARRVRQRQKFQKLNQKRNRK